MLAKDLAAPDSDFTAQLLIVEGKLRLHNSFDLFTVNDIF